MLPNNLLGPKCYLFPVNLFSKNLNNPHVFFLKSSGTPYLLFLTQINGVNYNFFIELLNRDFQDGNIIINNSNVFFKHIEDEVLFITKIFKMKYYFDSKELKNIFFNNHVCMFLNE